MIQRFRRTLDVSLGLVIVMTVTVILAPKRLVEKENAKSQVQSDTPSEKASRKIGG